MWAPRIGAGTWEVAPVEPCMPLLGPELLGVVTVLWPNPSLGEGACLCAGPPGGGTES